MAVKNDFYINAKGDYPASEFAYTMTPGGAGGKGSLAVQWNKSSGVGGASLPEDIRKILYGPTGQPGAFDPFTNATGYAVDPKTGQIIIRSGQGGGAQYTGAFAPGVGTGVATDMTMSSMGSEDDFTATGDTSAGSTSNTGGIGNLPPGVTVVSTFSDPTTGDVTATLSDGTTRILAKSGAASAEKKSAYDLLYQQFNDLGIGGLVPELKSFIEEGISPSEFTLRLRQTDSYKKRFAANAQRVAKGLRALSEAEYVGLEDQYQNVMRQYGLPENYYARGEMGRQEGFEKFISGDVSATELEDRISTAQRRVLNANPEVTQALKQFYPDITNADILAYTLDPKNAIENIKRKVTAAEIGGAAIQAGIGYSGDTPEIRRARAEELRAAGVTKESAQQGFGTIAGGLQRGSQLASIYGENPYTQTTAEQEVFGLAGKTEAEKQRKKLTGLEKATFGGQTGLTSGALVRDRAGAY
jgi:hypothetical protein